MYGSFLPGGQKKSRRDNEVREVNREAQSIHKGTGLGGQKGVTLIQLIL